MEGAAVIRQVQESVAYVRHEIMRETFQQFAALWRTLRGATGSMLTFLWVVMALQVITAVVIWFTSGQFSQWAAVIMAGTGWLLYAGYWFRAFCERQAGYMDDSAAQYRKANETLHDEAWKAEVELRQFIDPSFPSNPYFMPQKEGDNETGY